MRAEALELSGRGVRLASGKELVNGESALYLGRAYRIELVDAADAGVRFAGKFLIPRSRASERKRCLLYTSRCV